MFATVSGICWHLVCNTLKCLFCSVASGCGRRDPCLDAFVLNFQGGQGQKALIWKWDVPCQASCLSGMSWGYGESRGQHGGAGHRGQYSGETHGAGGVWSGWSHENAWQIRMQSMSNYGYNNVWLEYVLERHWQQQHTFFTPLVRWVLINERFNGS